MRECLNKLWVVVMESLKDVMKRDIVVVAPDDSLKDAVDIMASRNIGCVVVVDKNRPLGIITERDLVRKVLSKNIYPSEAKVKDVMTTRLISLDSGKTIHDAVDVLEKNNIKKLPVIEYGKLIGIVTMTDLLKSLRRTEDEKSEKLRETIKDLHLTKIKLQSRIIELEDKLNK